MELDLFSDDGSRFNITSAEWLKVLDKEKLIQYWKNNSAEIRQSNFTHQTKKVLTVNYLAEYVSVLPKVYEELDKLCEGTPAGATGSAGGEFTHEAL